MIRFFNFNMPKAKQFNYRPMYYDERKERLEKLQARAAVEASKQGSSVTAGYTSLDRGFLTERRAATKYRHSGLQAASVWRLVRLFVILVLLLSLTYYIAPEFFVVFWKIR